MCIKLTDLYSLYTEDVTYRWSLVEEDFKCLESLSASIQLQQYFLCRQQAQHKSIYPDLNRAVVYVSQRFSHRSQRDVTVQIVNKAYWHCLIVRVQRLLKA